MKATKNKKITMPEHKKASWFSEVIVWFRLGKELYRRKRLLSALILLALWVLAAFPVFLLLDLIRLVYLFVKHLIINYI